MKNLGILKDSKKKKKLHFKRSCLQLSLMFIVIFLFHCYFHYYKLNFVISTQMYKNMVYTKFGVSMVIPSGEGQGLRTCLPTDKAGLLCKYVNKSRQYDKIRSKENKL